MGADNGFTSLIWPLGKEDPDDAFSSVPYEKVEQPVDHLLCCFLRHTFFYEDFFFFFIVWWTRNEINFIF